MKYFLRFTMLVCAFALTTWGLVTWHGRDFAFTGFFEFAEFSTIHPVYCVVLGLALIPPTLWEIFLLESQAQDD